jgi:hypothetical protein
VVYPYLFKMNKMFTPTLLWAANGVKYDAKNIHTHVIVPQLLVSVYDFTPVLILFC